MNDKTKRWISDLQIHAVKEMAKNLGMLLGTEVRSSTPDWSTVALKEVLARFSPEGILSEFDIEGATSKKSGGIFLERKDGIMLGGSLAMLGEDALQEKIASQDLDETIFDALREVANQLVGYFDRAAGEKMADIFHFRHRETFLLKDHQPDFPEDREYVFLPFRFEWGKSLQAEPGFLVPAEIFYTYTESSTEKPEGKSSKDEQAMQTPAVAVIPVSSRVANWESLFEKQKAAVVKVAKASQLLELFQKGQPVRVLIIDGDGNVDAGIEICGKLRQAVRSRSVALWLAGEKWTEAKVREAVKAGADYVVALPPESPALQARIKRLFP
jgi:CheY-like chemotaxis protein